MNELGDIPRDDLEGPWLIGYGTLLSAASLSRDIGELATADKVFYPVEVPGYKRLFNLQPDHYESSRVLSVDGIERGAMNVQPSEGTSFNGVLFRASEEELVTLDQRERYYERVKVLVKAFGGDHVFGEAFVYSAGRGSQWVIDDPDRLMPRWLDIALGREGSYRLSREFGRMFDETTYLADGETLVVERYSDVGSFSRIPEGFEEGGRKGSAP